MKPIRTVVVDDEPLARARIVKLLHTDADLILVDECRNGAEAIDCIQKKKPDLIFLDIQMPDLNGFGVLTELDEDCTPFIIFVTAYDQYALKAFDVHAIDYLLKPFNDQRFFASLDRAKQQIALRQTATLGAKMFQLMREYQQAQGGFLQHIPLKENGRTMVIDLNEVQWIESNGNYATLHTDARFHTCRMTMNTLEAELDPSVFLRIHRSFIVNTRYIGRVTYHHNNEYLFLMQNNREISSGRSYKERIEMYLSDEPG